MTKEIINRRISVQDLLREWEKDPAFRAQYNFLEDEFVLATATALSSSR